MLEKILIIAGIGIALMLAIESINIESPFQDASDSLEIQNCKNSGKTVFSCNADKKIKKY